MTDYDKKPKDKSLYGGKTIIPIKIGGETVGAKKNPCSNKDDLHFFKEKLLY